mmetsp:Transcript_12835/g.50192  ORF Transcript_12835/g.50192 Transcript_12835/m.50192 type:complete len:240 (+) Transcript_12835:1875-2594(+)
MNRPRGRDGPVHPLPSVRVRSVRVLRVRGRGHRTNAVRRPHVLDELRAAGEARLAVGARLGLRRELEGLELIVVSVSRRGGATGPSSGARPSCGRPGGRGGRGGLALLQRLLPLAADPLELFPELDPAIALLPVFARLVVIHVVSRHALRAPELKLADGARVAVLRLGAFRVAPRRRRRSSLPSVRVELHSLIVVGLAVAVAVLVVHGGDGGEACDAAGGRALARLLPLVVVVVLVVGG